MVRTVFAIFFVLGLLAAAPWARAGEVVSGDSAGPADQTADSKEEFVWISRALENQKCIHKKEDGSIVAVQDHEVKQKCPKLQAYSQKIEDAYKAHKEKLGPKGPNDVFNYSAACKVAAENLIKKLPANRDAQNLVEDLDTLDNTTRLITNKNEDADFRIKVVSTSESMRQSVIYSFERLSQKAKVDIKKLKTICKAEKLQTSLAKTLAHEIDEMLLEMDGVDSDS